MNQDESADGEIGKFFSGSGDATDSINATGNGGDFGIRIPTFGRRSVGEVVGAVLSVAKAGNVAHIFKAVIAADDVESVKPFVGLRRIVSVKDGEISTSQTASRAVGRRAIFRDKVRSEVVE